MRLFAALTLPGEAVADLEAALAPVRRGAQAPRWVAPERWHLTLAFFGEVAEDRLPALRSRLQVRLSDRASLQLRLCGADRFGPQVLWMGVSGDVGPLHELADRVGLGHESAERVGLVDESAERLDRPYRPHLTLARAGLGEGAALRGALAALAGYEGPDWLAQSVHLVRSHRGARPRYETVVTWPLC